MSKNISRLSSRKGLDNNLFERLAKLQANQTGSDLSSDIHSLADEFLVGASTIFGSTSFYDLFRQENSSRKAFVCEGSACLCAGTQDEVRQTLEQLLSPEEIGSMTCLGRCHENYAFQIQGHNYSGHALQKSKEILQGNTDSSLDQYRVHALSGADLLTSAYSLEEFGSDLRELISRDPAEIIEELKASRLRGRGGAGFPVGLKWEACRNADTDGKNPDKYIVCNADEGDPGAYSDRYLLEQQSLKVIFGMLAAARVTTAKTGIIYIRAEYPQAIEQTLDSIRLLMKKSMLGENILDTSFSFSLKVIQGAGAYICGEETSLLASIEGRRPEVDVRPPYPVTRGLYQQPTVVNNVESLAAVPILLRSGGREFADMGTDKSTGTKLLSLDSFFNKPGIYEVAMGTPLAEIVDAAEGFRAPVKALHIGGPLGGLVPVGKVPELKLDFESFDAAGFLLGHAGVVCIPEDLPIIEYLAHLFEFTAAESCGKCFPCRLGSVRGHEMLRNAIDDGQKIDRQLLDDLLQTMELGSLCGLGGGLPLPVKNALSYFEDELRVYFS